MFGKGVHQEEELLLRDIVRSINKKLDYTAREGAGSQFTLHMTLRGHESDVVLNLDDLIAGKADMIKRHRIRQKIKAAYDHLDRSRYNADVLGLKPAKLLRSSPKPEPMALRGPGRGGPRR